MATLHRCSSCSKTGFMSACAKCTRSYYCSRNCQVKHWPTHKLSCGKSAEELAAIAEERYVTNICIANQKIIGNIAIMAAYNEGKEIIVDIDTPISRFNPGSLYCAWIGISDNTESNPPLSVKYGNISVLYRFTDYTRTLTPALTKSTVDIRKNNPSPGDSFHVMIEL